MKKTMIISTIIMLVLLTGISFSSAENNSVAGKQTNDSSENFTAAVAAILKNYNADTLTSTDARAINDAFRQAGVKQGEAQKAAIKAAGFDPQKISSLDPPPEKNGEQRMKQNNGTERR